MTVTVNRAQGFVAVKNTAAVDDVARVHTAQAFVAIRNTQALDDVAIVHVAQAFIVIRDVNARDITDAVVVNRVEGFTVIKQTEPGFYIDGDELKYLYAIPGVYSVDIQSEDSLADTFTKNFSITIT